VNIKIVCEDPSKEREYVKHIVNHCMGIEELPMKLILLPENQKEALSSNQGWTIKEKLMEERKEKIEAYGIKIEPYTRRAWVNEKELSLTRIQYDILAFMVKNPDRVLTKEDFRNEIWPWVEEVKTKEASLTVHITRIRKKIEEDQSNFVTIETVWGVGYRLGVPK